VDLNELFSRHQIALIRLDRTGKQNEHDRLSAHADMLVSRIAVIQRQLGAVGATLAKGAMA
jgi:hypothetical protein